MNLVENVEPIHFDRQLTQESLEKILSLLSDNNSQSATSYILQRINEAIEHDLASEGLALDLDGKFRESAAAAADERRAGFISDQQIRQVFRSRFDCDLTTAELGLLKSLMTNRTLREISEDTGVSYETRRAQLKGLLSKAGLNRQAELLMIVSTLATSQINAGRQPPPGPREAISSMIENLYDCETRAYHLTMSSGRPLHVVDFGPLDGQVVIAMHATFLPFFPMPDQSDLLDRLNIRVLMPVRPGFFSTAAADGDPNEMTEYFARDVADFVKTFKLAEAPVISHTIAVHATLRLLYHSPRHRQVVICSPTYLGPHKWSQPGYLTEAIRLARRSNKASTAVFGFITKLITPKERLKATFSRIYGNSTPDLANLEAHEALFAHVPALAAQNLSGIATDLALMQEDWTTLIRPEAENITLIFGKHDPHCDYEQALARITNRGVRIRVVEEFGQSSAMFEPEYLFLTALS